MTRGPEGQSFSAEPQPTHASFDLHDAIHEVFAKEEDSDDFPDPTGPEVPEVIFSRSIYEAGEKVPHPTLERVTIRASRHDAARLKKAYQQEQ